MNFKTIYLGYCSAGVLMREQTTIDRDEARPDSKELARFREHNAPNCYGVGQRLGDEEQLIDFVLAYWPTGLHVSASIKAA